VNDVGRGVGGFILKQVLSSYLEVIMGVVAIVRRDRFHGPFEGCEHPHSGGGEQNTTGRVGGKHQCVSLADPRGTNDVEDFISNVQGIEAAAGLGLELGENDHTHILAQPASLGIGRAFGAPEQTFKSRAAAPRYVVEASMIEPSPPTENRSFLEGNEFRMLCEIEPPRKPDLEFVREQIEVLNPVTDAFLIPDNHLGRATVSSVAVAHEVGYMGGHSIACLNARDRNLLGFRRDLLTAASYGVDHFLFVYGDPPHEGRRAEDLTVRGMMDEVRNFGTGPLFAGYPDFKIGTTARPGRDLAWRARADFLFVQITYSIERLIEWRASIDFTGQVYAGVLVLASTRMARRVNASLPDIRIPERIIDKLDDDPSVGLDLACEQIEAIVESGMFDGIHLVPVSRFREMAERVAAMQNAGKWR
jgi:methylenetetrahydrofolate reductase (NADPH)